MAALMNRNSRTTASIAVRLIPLADRSARALGRMMDAEEDPDRSMVLLQRYARAISWQADLDPLAFR